MTDLALCYLLAGAALTAVLRARRRDLSLGDALLTLALWPLYAPLRFASGAAPAPVASAHREQALLEEALAAATVSSKKPRAVAKSTKAPPVVQARLFGEEDD